MTPVITIGGKSIVTAHVAGWTYGGTYDAMTIVATAGGGAYRIEGDHTEAIESAVREWYGRTDSDARDSDALGAVKAPSMISDTCKAPSDGLMDRCLT